MNMYQKNFGKSAKEAEYKITKNEIPNVADKFSITIFLSSSIFWITNDLNIKSVTLLYIGVISTFSYVFAAYHKIISPMWRNGKGLSGLFKTEYYGSYYRGG